MINSLILFAAYLLGASIFVIEEIKKYKNVANANPDPAIVFKSGNFFEKEKLNLVQMALYGIVAVIILPKLFGGSNFVLENGGGAKVWSIPMKQALVPIMIIIGWTGGAAVISLLGKSKKELYKKVGIDEIDN